MAACALYRFPHSELPYCPGLTNLAGLSCRWVRRSAVAADRHSPYESTGLREGEFLSTPTLASSAKPLETLGSPAARSRGAGSLLGPIFAREWLTLPRRTSH